MMGLELQTQHLPAAPAHWQWTRLSRVVQFKNGADYKTVETEEPGYPVYGSGGLFRWANSWLHNGPSVLFGRKGTIDRPLYVEGKFWTVDTMFYTVPDQAAIDPRFLYYWATRFPFGKYMSNTALPSMTQSDLGSEAIALPPMSEQQKIVEFLDNETAEIDASIADQFALIELAEEKRESTIDSYLYASDSRQTPLKHLGRLRTGITLGTQYDEQTQEYPYLRVANVQTDRVDLTDIATVHVPQHVADANRLVAGDVLMTEGGDRDKLGRGALWHGEVKNMLHQNHIFTFRCNENLISEYLVYVLESSKARYYFDITAKQSTNLASTNSTTVKRFRVPFRRLEEQRAIVDSLDIECAALGEIIADAERTIELSRERRAALISAAVTGQIDVTQKRIPVAEVLENEVGLRV